MNSTGVYQRPRTDLPDIHPNVGDCGSAWIEAFDNIDSTDLVTKANRKAAPKR